MSLVFAIISAVIIIYFYNWYLASVLKKKRDISKLICLLAPVIEESVKTFLAIATDNSILLVHLGVGTVEGTIDMLSKFKISNLVIAVLIHGIFGLLTRTVFVYSGYVIIGWAVAVIFHCIWNLLILNINKDVVKRVK